MTEPEQVQSFVAGTLVEVIHGNVLCLNCRKKLKVNKDHMCCTNKVCAYRDVKLGLWKSFVAVRGDQGLVEV